MFSGILFMGAGGFTAKHPKTAENEYDMLSLFYRSENREFKILQSKTAYDSQQRAPITDTSGHCFAKCSFSSLAA